MSTVRIPKYCFHAPTGQAYIRVRGRTIYLGKHGTAASREAYGKAIAEFSASPSKATIATPVSANDLTVVELCSAYQDFADGWGRLSLQYETTSNSGAMRRWCSPERYLLYATFRNTPLKRR